MSAAQTVRPIDRWLYGGGDANNRSVQYSGAPGEMILSVIAERLQLFDGEDSNCDQYRVLDDTAMWAIDPKHALIELDAAGRSSVPNSRVTDKGTLAITHETGRPRDQRRSCPGWT